MEFQACSDIDRQCTKKRSQLPTTLFTFIDDPYRTRHFTYSADGKRRFIKSTVNTVSDGNGRNQNDGKLNPKRYRRDYYQSIRYKEMTLSVGDSVEVRNANSETSGPQWPTNVAMIKEICDDEDSDIPMIVIFWYWRERELKWNLEAKDRYDIKIPHQSFMEERRQCIDYHIYCDTDYVDEIYLDTIIHPVVVVDKYLQFKQHVDAHPHSKVFYGELFVSASDLSFKSEPKDEFRERQMRQIREMKQHRLSQPAIPSLQSLRGQKVTTGPAPNGAVNGGKTKKKSRADIPIFERMKLGLMDSDSSSSDDGNQSSGSTGTESEGKKLKKRSARKVLIEEHLANISREDMATMDAICGRLTLSKGPNIGSRLYHFGSHLAAYQCLDELFRVHSEQTFGGFVQRQKQTWCRDVKYALYTKGQIVPLTVMKENIRKRFVELKPRYDAACNGKGVLNGNGNGRKRNGMNAADGPPSKRRRVL